MVKHYQTASFMINKCCENTSKVTPARSNSSRTIGDALNEKLLMSTACNFSMPRKLKILIRYIYTFNVAISVFFPDNTINFQLIQLLVAKQPFMPKLIIRHPLQEIVGNRRFLMIVLF